MKKLYTLISLLSSGFLLAQSPWTQEKGKFYTQLSFSTISNYDEVFGDPEYNTGREITDNTLQLYSEYGLTSKTTLVLNVPLKFIRSGNPIGQIPIIKGDSITALGNVGFGVKHQFYKKKWIISGQLNVEANTGTFDNSSGIRTGRDAWTFTPTINIGRSFDKFYVQAFTGIDITTNDYSTNFKIGGEIGTKVHRRIWLVGFLDIVNSFNDGDVDLPISNVGTALYVNNQEYAAFGLKAIGEINKSFGGILTFGGAFSGNNVAKQAALTVGVYHKF
ncbi:transporter [uncultured Kordia sp.]|uniref:transporter n=1 Tax=uncultured Kordia sp. TaxID=507699 RepID=UPI00262F3D19|nr:transporter [uncultured Kordia sp.]